MSFIQTPASDILAGKNGGVQFPAGTYTGLELDSVVIRSATVFTSFTVARVEDLANGTNVLTTRRYNGITFNAFEYLNAGKGYKITGFVISSGSVMGY